MSEQTDIKSGKTVQYQQAERALDAARITDPAIRSEALSLITRFREILDQNRQYAGKGVVRYLRPKEPFIFRILREYGEQLDAQPPMLQLRQMEHSLGNNLKSRQYVYNIKNRDIKNRDDFPDLKPLYADSIITRATVERLISDLDRAWLAKYRPEQAALAAPPEPAQIPMPVRADGPPAQALVQTGSVHLSPNFMDDHKPADDRARRLFGSGGDAMASPPPQPDPKTDHKIPVPGEEPVIVQILRQLGSRLDAGTLCLRDLLEPVGQNLRSREFYYRKKYRKKNLQPPEAGRLTAETVLTRPLLERLMLPGDHAWLAKYGWEGAPDAPVRDLLKPARDGSQAAVSTQRGADNILSDPKRVQAVVAELSPITDIPFTPPAMRASPTAEVARTQPETQHEPVVQFQPVKMRHIPSKAPPLGTPAVKRSSSPVETYSMFQSLVPAPRPLLAGRELPYQSFGVQKRRWAEAKDEAATGRFVSDERLKEPDICDFLKTNLYWKARLVQEKDNPVQGIPLGILRQKDSDAADAWDARREAIASFLIVYADTPPEERIRFTDTQDEHVSLKPNASALPDKQRDSLKRLHAAMGTKGITLTAIGNVAMATAFMEKFAAYHPISSEMDPKTRIDALKKIPSFPKLGETNEVGPDAAKLLFEKYWQRPILLKVLTLGDFKKYDPESYTVLARTGTHGLFNRLNNVLLNAVSHLDLARPSAETHTMAPG